MTPPPPSKDERLEAVRAAVLGANEEMQKARGKASRAKAGFARAKGPEARKRARRALVSALGDLRSATLAEEVSRANLRRELSPVGRAAAEAVLAALDRATEHYADVGRLFEEHSAAYDSARRHYLEERRWAERQARITPRFDALLKNLEEALFERDRALTDAHRAQRRTLDALGAASATLDEHQRRPTPSNRLRRAESMARAHAAYVESERHAQSFARALSRWFEADKTFHMAFSALEVTRGFAEVQRLQLAALELLRASARLSLASIVTDEALAQVTRALGDLRTLR